MTIEYSRGSVRQRTDMIGKPWQAIVRYKENGVWHTTSKTFDLGLVRNKTEALHAMDDWRNELQRVENSNLNPTHYVADYVFKYIDGLEARHAVEPSTVKGYRETTKYIREAFQHVRLDALTSDMVAKFEADLVSRGLSASTVGKAHRLLKQVCKHAVNVDDLAKNPCDAVKPPKRKAVNPNALDARSRREVAEYVASHKPTPLVTGIALALFAGLHSAECCGLKWVDVDLDAPSVRVTEAIGYGEGGTYTKEPKNDKRRRTIDIPPQLADILRSRKYYVMEQCSNIGILLKPSYYVISDNPERYYAPTRLSKSWTDLADANGWCGITGKKVRFHDLRHTFATVAIAEGIDVKTVSSMMGHANAAMTLNIYASADPEAKRAAAKRIGEAYNFG